MKKILIPSQIMTLPDGSRFVGIRQSYTSLLTRLSLVPQIITPFFELNDLESLVGSSGGILLLGGSDVSPQRYGQTLHPTTQVKEPERDELELRLTKIALAQKKPILGICRGCQVMAVASSGSLIQHIPDIVKDEIHSVENYYQLDRSPKHGITLDPSSRLSSILGKVQGFVNSAHHQAVDDVGPEFKKVAFSNSGVCEAIEHTDKDYFCFGVQNHPEMEGNDGLFEPLLQAFVAAVDR